MSKDSDQFDFDGKYGMEYQDFIFQIIPGYKHFFIQMASCMKTMLNDNDQVLTIGVGSGLEMIALSDANPTWRLTGIDTSANMLEITRKNFEKFKVSNKFELFHGYIQDYPNEQVFSGATCFLVMHFLDDEDKQPFLNEIAARLKPNGMFMLLNPYAEYTEFPSLQQFADMLFNYGEQRGVTREKYLDVINRSKSALKLSSAEQMTEMLEIAGFQYIFPIFKAFAWEGWMAFKKVI